MAALHSIGVRRPAAFWHLVAESILAPDSTERDYTWTTYAGETAEDPVDEVVATRYHVVWSRGGIVRKLFNFEAEKETVVQALLSSFSTQNGFSDRHAAEHDLSSLSPTQKSSAWSAAQRSESNSFEEPPLSESSTHSRALVVLLRSQAHIFFLSGTAHIVHLPFEVEKAFPAALGILVQRLASRSSGPTSFGQIPSVPPNSFKANYISSLETASSSTHTQWLRSLPPDILADRIRLRGQDETQSNSPFLPSNLPRGLEPPKTEDLPRIYALTNPLSELLPVAKIRRVINDKTKPSHRDIVSRVETLDVEEDMLYVSPSSELKNDIGWHDHPFLLAVTINHDALTLTLWTAAYVSARSMSNSLKRPSMTRGHKLRRRSSFVPTAAATGNTTPDVRDSDHLKTSRGPNHRNRKSQASSKTALHGRLTDQAVEDVLSSQLNPVFDTSRQPRESRRVSSLLSRAELSNSFDRPAPQEFASQRHSLGGNHSANMSASQRSRRSHGFDRNSFGGFPHPKNRASASGSVSSRMSLTAISVDEVHSVPKHGDAERREDSEDPEEYYGSRGAGEHETSAHKMREEVVMSSIAEIPIAAYQRINGNDEEEPRSSNQVRYTYVDDFKADLKPDECKSLYANSTCEL